MDDHSSETEVPYQEQRSKTWIQTVTGKKVDLLSPKKEDFDPFDIAHAQSNLCRFTGHTKRFYSVAEHSLRVSFRCEELAAQKENGDLDSVSVARAARWGLLHDAAEAYVNDLSRPLKHQPELAMYRSIEKRIMGAIAERFELGPEAEEVAQADDELLWTECRDLMSPMHPDWASTARKILAPLDHVTCVGFGSEKARRLWLLRFQELFPTWGKQNENPTP